jgi:4-amino-4-deoxy-L-arabinose transferase-like glycosyltransferase
LLWLLWGRLLATMAVKSATFDEPLHVMQGVLYWQSWQLYPVVENPPLVNAIVGLPVTLLLQPTLPVDHPAWAGGDWLAISQAFTWEMNGNGLMMLFLGRLAIVCLTLLLAALVARWAKELAGSAGAGLLALFLYTFDPAVLANGHLATADLGLAFFLALAALLVWRYWRGRRRSAWRYGLVGIAIGGALAAKFSGLILLPALLLLAVYRAWRTGPGGRRRIVAEALGWLAIAALTLLVVYRFDAGALATDFQQQRAHQLGGHSAFLAGELSQQGWWRYLPFVFLIKTPLVSLALLAAGLVTFTWQRRWSWPLLWLLLVGGGVMAAGLLSRVAIGYRYLLPALPLLHLFISQAIRPLVARHRPAAWLVGAGCLFLLGESLAFHPDYLAYFNQLAGGPENGWRYVVDSNIDWGQDIQALADYTQSRGIGPVQVAWLGSAPLSAYGVNGVAMPIWPFAEEDPFSDPFYPDRPGPGTYVISATRLQGVYLDNPHRFDWFRARPPSDKVGYSLFVYEVAAEGLPARLALSGIGVSHLAPADFERAFAGNNVAVGWHDARRSLLWLGGGESAVWSAVGLGHLPSHPALRALYPEAGPTLIGRRQDNAGGWWEYALFRWSGSPIQAALSQAGAITAFGWSPLAQLGSGQWEAEWRPLPGPALFDQTWELLGYTPLGEGAVRPGAPLELLSYWRLHRQPAGELKMFVHLVDEAGRIVAQDDALDVVLDGLRPGDEVAQLHTLQLPPDLLPGRYALQLGLYDSATLARLAVAVDADNGADRVLLHALEIPAP